MSDRANDGVAWRGSNKTGVRSVGCRKIEIKIAKNKQMINIHNTSMKYETDALNGPGTGVGDWAGLRLG